MPAPGEGELGAGVGIGLWYPAQDAEAQEVRVGVGRAGAYWRHAAMRTIVESASGAFFVFALVIGGFAADVM